MDRDRPRRQVTLTDAGFELLTTTVDKHNRTLSKLSREIQQYCVILNSGECHKDDLMDTLDSLHGTLQQYVGKSDEFIRFLTAARTDEADRELYAHRMIRDSLVRKVEELLRSFTTKPKEVPAKAPSVKTRKSARGSSRLSGISGTSGDLLLKQKTKAEAARKKLEFVREESELMNQKAQNEASYIIQKAQFDAKEKGLLAKKDAAVASAELQVLEDALDEEEDKANEAECTFRKQHLDNYLSEQNIRLSQRVKDNDDCIPRQHGAPQYISDNVNVAQPQHRTVVDNIPLFVPDPPILSNTPVDTSSRPAMSVADDLVKFLVKKDILTSRFYKYDDQCENYISWKDTFVSVIKEISATPSEELDLMMQYTGPDSHKQLKSIIKNVKCW